MLSEHRRDERYMSSQKAVMNNGNAANNLCVIKNLSSGGLCFAVVGAPMSFRNDRVDLRVTHGNLLCNVVGRGKGGLHCRFDSPIDDPDLRRMSPFARIDARSEMLSIEQRRRVDGSAGHTSYDKNGRWRLDGAPPSTASSARGLTIIYSEGGEVGRQQIDPSIDALDATVDVLNPYLAAVERDHWAMGFKDAIRHMAKNFAPLG